MEQEVVSQRKPQRRIRLNCPNCKKVNWISVVYLLTNRVKVIKCRYCKEPIIDVTSGISITESFVKSITPLELRRFARFTRQTM